MNANALPFAYFHNKFVKIEDANVSIMTHSLQYGTAIFGGIRAYYNQDHGCIYLFRLNDHYDRLLSAAKIIGCALPYSREQLTHISIELVRKNKPMADSYLRPYAYVGHTELGPNLANTTLDFALYMLLLGEYLPIHKGLRLMVSSWRRISDNAIPVRAKASGGYINSSLARKEASDRGYDEAIMLHENGHVSEGSAENIFIVRNGILLTPSTSEGILEGITRRTVIELAHALGIPTESRPIERTELYSADELFLSGTGCQIAWVSSVDDRQIGNGKQGPICKRLQDEFFKVVRGENSDYRSWLTAVKVRS
jgi:branched-chain amino acid aminotransferase